MLKKILTIYKAVSDHPDVVIGFGIVGLLFLSAVPGYLKARKRSRSFL